MHIYNTCYANKLLKMYRKPPNSDPNNKLDTIITFHYLTVLYLYTAVTRHGSRFATRALALQCSEYGFKPPLR